MRTLTQLLDCFMLINRSDYICTSVNIFNAFYSAFQFTCFKYKTEFNRKSLQKTKRRIKMSFNPFEEKGQKVDSFYNWCDMNPAPYDKFTVDPYTKTRIILMNGTEFEANWFSHQMQRHTDNNDLRRELALLRRVEQQQQKRIGNLKPLNETPLETTIAYEQLAVDLTAALAEHEPNEYVKNALDFALLEDFDHLYRYADLLEMEQGADVKTMVGGYTEIMPGRPTIVEHRHPFDDVRRHIDGKKSKPITRLNVGIITAAEQQTMNFYMNVASLATTDASRRLYTEIAMIEEQHVTHYGSLMDTTCTWLEGLLEHQYTECYLYYSCMMTECDAKIKKIWEQHLYQEIGHLHYVAELLYKYENKEWEDILGRGSFPEPVSLHGNIGYVRDVIKNTVNLNSNREDYVACKDMPSDCEYFSYTRAVNGDKTAVSSHNVIETYMNNFGSDYRYETDKHPIL